MKHRTLYLIALLSFLAHGSALALPWSHDMYDQSSYKPQEITHPKTPKGTVRAKGRPVSAPVKTKAEALNLINPIAPSDKSLARGKVLFDIYCAVCHGKEGLGDGKVGKKYLSASDLTSDYVTKLPDGSVYFTITYGGQAADAKMPAYKAAIAPEDRWHIINYMKYILSWQSPIRMPAKPAYMGAATCGGRCHDPWYRAWKDTPHARTYELLKPGIRAEAKRKAHLDPNADYTKNPSCLRCHTTGFGQNGGFIPGETLISKSQPSLEQVGCEMCHTLRGGNQVRVIMKKTGGKFKRKKIEQWGARYDYENVCYRCHEHPKNPHNSSLDPKYAFHYKEKKKHIHDYKKYYNDFNKKQVYTRGKGQEQAQKKRAGGRGAVTESHPLMIEDWDIVKGKIRFKKLPLWEGWLIFKGQ